MSLTSSRPLLGIALVLAAALLFASHDAISKQLSLYYPIVFIVWARYLVHGLLMAGLFLPRHGVTLLHTKKPVLQIVRALCLLMTTAAFATGLKYLPLAEACAVNFLAPLFVTALSVPLLKERVSAAQWCVVITGFVGVLFIVHPSGELFRPEVLWPLCSALFFCFYQLLTRHLAAFDSALTSNLLTGLINTLVVSLVLPFYWVTPALEHLWLVVLIGTCGMFAQLFFTQAFGFAAPALLAPLGYAQVVFAGILGWLLFKHTPDIWGLTGIALICLSGALAAWLGARPAKAGVNRTPN